MKRFLFVAGVLSLFLRHPVSAPHIQPHAMYEMSSPTYHQRPVKRFEWTNPHAFIYLDVKDDKGNSVEWGDRADEPSTTCARTAGSGRR